jgi:membrane dipeptidase
VKHTLTSALFLLLLLLGSCAAPERVAPEIRAPRLAREVLILDGHVDVPIRLYGQKHSGGDLDDVTARSEGGDFDWERAVAGGLDAPFMSIYTPASSEDEGNSKAMADELIDLVEGIAATGPEKFTIARTAKQVRRAFRDGKIALLMGMENGSPIEGDLANLDHFFERGVRYITLCHSKDNHICDSSYDDRHTHRGLTPFGREVVERMNRLGIMVDVSHISDDSFWQVMELTRAPAIASHSSLRHFVPGFERNMSDEMVRRLAENGGVIQINFGSSFLTAEANAHGDRRRQAQERFREEHGVEARSAEDRAFRDEWTASNPFPFATVAVVADHIDRVVELAGIDHVGLGSDFDGVGPTLPIGLEDVSGYPNLLAELLRRGYSEGDVAKICSGNVLRVMEQVERIAAASR